MTNIALGQSIQYIQMKPDSTLYVDTVSIEVHRLTGEGVVFSAVIEVPPDNKELWIDVSDLISLEIRTADSVLKLNHHPKEGVQQLLARVIENDVRHKCIVLYNSRTVSIQAEGLDSITIRGVLKNSLSSTPVPCRTADKSVIMLDYSSSAEFAHERNYKEILQLDSNATIITYSQYVKTRSRNTEISKLEEELANKPFQGSTNTIKATEHLKSAIRGSHSNRLELFSHEKTLYELDSVDLNDISVDTEGGLIFQSTRLKPGCYQGRIVVLSLEFRQLKQYLTMASRRALINISRGNQALIYGDSATYVVPGSLKD